MRPRIIGRLVRDESGRLKNASSGYFLTGGIWETPHFFEEQESQPIRIDAIDFGLLHSASDLWSKDVWVFRGCVIMTDSLADEAPPEAYDELKLEIRHLVLKAERRLARVKREVQALENLERIPSAIRERIPDEIRVFVWQRDQGKCVRCGRKEGLEFDHVIPLAEGGATTERNIQLLCLPCNRAKGKNI